MQLHNPPKPHLQQQQQRNPLHPSVLEKLDPAFIQLYNEYIANGPPPSSDLTSLRANYSTLYSYATAPASGVGGIGETTVPGWDKYPGDINVRVYVPPGEDAGLRKVWPVHFNFHGGGWAVGDLETDAHICHHICASTPCCVIDVEYRLIPEYPFPIGIMDCLSAVCHVLANHKCFSIDPMNVTLGGESAGGTIALILNHLMRDTKYGDRLQGIVVGTPTIADLRKFTAPEETPWPSMREAENAPLLNWQKLKWFDTYKWTSLASQHMHFSHKERHQDTQWFANALDAPDFKDLAPLTWIGTAEVDPLRDEAEEYANKLEEAGNNVVLRRFNGVPHAFMHMDKVLPQARDYVQEVISHIRKCMYPPATPPQVDGLKQDEQMET